MFHKNFYFLFFIFFILFLNNNCFFVKTQTASSGDADVFELFWSKLNDLMTPNWAAWQEGAIPNQMFLMEMPGMAINGEDFDDDLWRRNAYAGNSPDYLRHLLVDIAPAFSNYFVDSGFRISKLWEQFMLNARTTSPHNDPYREARYLSALNRLYDEDFQPRPIQQTRQDLLDEWAASFDAAIDSRAQCLLRDNRDPDTCAQKAVIWAEELTADWFAYETLNRDLMGTQSQILQLQSNDLHLLIAEAMETFFSYRRSEVGAENLFATYYNVILTPSDWYNWFITNATASTNPFVSVSINSDEAYQEREATFSRFFSNTTDAPRFDRPFMRVTSSDPNIDQGYVDLTSSATQSSTQISFEVAKVKVERPWLDLGLLRYYPIAITGLEKGEWSTETVNPDAMFPLLPTAFIVARNVQIQSTWETSMQETLTQASNSTGDVNVQIGPFSVGADSNQYNSDFSGSSSSSFDASSGTLTIEGPQIIGWICTKVPYFPNSDGEEIDAIDAENIKKADIGTVCETTDDTTDDTNSTDDNSTIV